MNEGSVFSRFEPFNKAENPVEQLAGNAWLERRANAPSEALRIQLRLVLLPSVLARGRAANQRLR